MIEFLRNIRGQVDIAKCDLIARARTLNRPVPTREQTLARVCALAEARGLSGRWMQAKVAYLAQGVSWEKLVQRSIEKDPQFRFIPGADLIAAYARSPEEAEELLGETEVLFIYPFLGYQNLLPWLRRRRFVFLITWDDTFDFYSEQMAGYARKADCLLSQAPESARRYLSIGVPWLFFAEGGHEYPFPGKRPSSFVLSYVGNLSGKRAHLIRRLEQRLGADFVVYGPGSARGPIPAERAMEVQREASASLAISDMGRGFGVTHFKCRHFEIPCCGGLLLAEYTPGLENMFEPDKEALMYRSFEECIEKARWIRNHPDEAWEIRKAGHRRAIKEHTWLARFRGLLQELEGVHKCRS